MIDPRHLELIHAEIDGENSSEASVEFRELLANNAQAREEWRRLKALSQTLDRVPDIDPPDDLRDVVMAAAGTPPPVRVIPRRRPAASIRYGLAFAAGLTLGLVGYHMIVGGAAGLDPAALSGAMVQTGAVETRIDVDGLRGAAEVAVTHGAVEIRIELDPADAVRAELSFDAESFAVDRLKHGDLDDFEVASGRVAWGQATTAGVTIRLTAREAEAGPFRLELFREGLPVHSTILQTNFPARRL